MQSCLLYDLLKPFVWVYLNVEACMHTCRASVLWFLLKTVTGPHCSINGNDKSAAPSGALVHNPFPKYPASITWCMFLSLEMYIQYKQEVRGNAMLGSRFLWGLLLLISSVCYIDLLNCCNITLKALLFFPERFLPPHYKSAQIISLKLIIHQPMPVKTSWMPNQINSSSAYLLLCNCLTRLTCRC